VEAVCRLSMITACHHRYGSIYTTFFTSHFGRRSSDWSTIYCDQTARQTSGYIVCTWLKYHEWIRRNKCT